MYITHTQFVYIYIYSCYKINFNTDMKQNSWYRISFYGASCWSLENNQFSVFLSMYIEGRA